MENANLRALLVEDDPSWQEILTEILTDAALNVDLADNLEEAVEHLRATPHRLAVVDLSLGGSDHRNQDGLRVLDAVRHHDPRCAALLLTGFATVELAVSALRDHGAFTCLRKETFNRSEFREMIDRALASQPPLRTTPLPQDEAHPSEGREEKAPPLEETPIGLALVVEDDAGWRSILSELVSEAGYQTRLCSSYGEAQGYLRREKHALAVVDLSLSDTRPITTESSSQEQEGYQLLTTIQALGTPAIVVSGTASTTDIERAYSKYGVFAFLEKQTFDRRTFLRTIDEARAAEVLSSEIDCLTRREREVLELLAQGLTNKEIAQALVITTNTVKRHLKAIFEKLDVHTRSAAAAKAISAGMPAELDNSQK